MDILDFLLENVHHGKVTSETITFRPRMPSHTQICLDLPRVLLGSFGGIVRLKITQNEKVFNF